MATGRRGAQYGNTNAKGNGMGGKIGQATTGALFGYLGSGVHSGMRAASGKSVNHKSAAAGVGAGGALIGAAMGGGAAEIATMGAISSALGYGTSRAGGAIGKKIASRKTKR